MVTEKKLRMTKKEEHSVIDPKLLNFLINDIKETGLGRETERGEEQEPQTLDTEDVARNDHRDDNRQKGQLQK